MFYVLTVEQDSKEKESSAKSGTISDNNLQLEPKIYQKLANDK